MAGKGKEKANVEPVVSKVDPVTVFELIERIGSGSYGDVYKARVKLSGELAAVKVIVLEPGENLDEVLNEVEILKSCNHSNIVKYFGCYERKGNGPDERQIWIGMEFCGGGSIESIYKLLQKPFTESEIAATMKEAIQGLHYLHSMNKIHRDIKGGNLLLTTEGSLKLADFGVSVQLTKTMNKRKTVIGSPYWMAPEVISAEEKDEAYDARCDIWSVAITAIEMAELAPPWYDLHPMRALFMIPKKGSPTLTHKHLWSENFHNFLALCLNKNPKKRPEAKALLSHPFISGVGRPELVLREIVERCQVKANVAAAVTSDQESDDEDTPSVEDTRLAASASEMSRPRSTIRPASNSISLDNIGYAPVPLASDTVRRSSTKPNAEDGAGSSAGEFEQLIQQLVGMGFAREDVPDALRQAKNNLERAVDLLIADASTREAIQSEGDNYVDLLEEERKRADIVRQDEELARKLQRSESANIGPTSQHQILSDEQLARTLQAQVISASPPAASYRMNKICRLRKHVTCGDFWEDQNILILGIDEGLVAVMLEDTNKQTLFHLSPRTYYQVFILEDLAMMVAISGRQKQVSIHDLRPLISSAVAAGQNKPNPFSLFQQKFESKTNMKRLGNSKGTEAFKIERLGDSIFLTMIKPKGVIITRWAPHPFNSFKKVKDLSFDRAFLDCALHEAEGGDLRLFVAFTGYFELIDIETNQGHAIQLDNSVDARSAVLPKAIMLLSKNRFLLCHDEFGARVDGSAKPLGENFTWRAPLKDALTLGSDAVVTISTTRTLDIWSVSRAQLVQTFHNGAVLTPLRGSKNFRVLLAYSEERQQSDGTYAQTTSILSIVSEWQKAAVQK